MYIKQGIDVKDLAVDAKELKFIEERNYEEKEEEEETIIELYEERNKDERIEKKNTRKEKVDVTMNIVHITNRQLSNFTKCQKEGCNNKVEDISIACLKMLQGRLL